MYITDLRIQNVKLLRDFKLSFGRHDEPRMWTVLIGANGACKTAVLQCIAMVATGHSRSNQLVDVAAIPDRRTKTVARVAGTFTFGRLGHSRRTYPGRPEEDRERMPGLRSSTVVAPGEKEILGSSQYFTTESERLRLAQPPRGITSAIRRQEGFLDELARLFDSEAAALSLLDTIGFPHDRSSSHDGWMPVGFWERTLSALDEDELARLIRAAARFYPDNPKLNRWLTAYSSAKNLVDPLEVVRAKDLPDWFFAAYGTSRLLPTPLGGQRPRSPSEDRVATLFDHGSIIGTEFARILDENESFTEAVREALITSGLLPAATDIRLHDRGWARSADDVVEGDLVTLRQGDRSVEVPATWLSQGYQSVVSWIADLVGWFYFEHQKPVPLEEMEGLVLIDEIDLHLHPAWQEKLIPAVRRVFPRLQFVVTTHSSMVLTGLKPEEIVVLDQDTDGNVVPSKIDDVPAFLTGSQIYDRYFGVRRVEAARLGSALRRHGMLSTADPDLLDDEDRQELERLRGQLIEAGIDPENGQPL